MTNALTEAEKEGNYYKRLSMKGFWEIRKDVDIHMIIVSFLRDPRFYGAEWNYSPLEELEGILAPYITHPIDSVEIVRSIRDPYDE